MENTILAKNTEEARKLIEKASKNKEKIIVQGKDIEFNRKVLENKKVDILILNHKIGKDKLKERDSGLNQVLCKIARNNNITLAIDFNEIINSEKREKAIILGRIKQNIKLIKKFKNKLTIINPPEDKISLSALFRVLGADTKLASYIV
ncbi:MAG: RNase P subunit p30 family protein [Nanoarchaeota archaeon]